MLRHEVTVPATERAGPGGIDVSGGRRGGSPAEGDRLHRVKDIAERSRVSVREVRRWIAAGELAVHRFGRAIRIAEADYLRFLTRHRQGKP